MRSMDSKYNVIISPSVFKSIDDTLSYLINTYGANTAAANLFTEWKDAVARISLYPYAMAKVTNQNVSDGKEYHKFFVGNFITIYNIDEAHKTIKILAFRYAPSKLGDQI